ncbi:MAG TPA: Ig domain-containing protein [Blastocatellia bacterium]
MSAKAGRIATLIIASFSIIAWGLPLSPSSASSASSQNSVGGGANGGSMSMTATIMGTQTTASQPPIAPVTLPPQGGSVSNQAGSASAGITGLPASTTGIVTDTSTGSITSSSAQAQSTSTVNGLNALGGLVTASSIVANASSTGSGTTATSSGSGSFANGLQVGDTYYGDTEFAPNTSIPVSGSVSATAAGMPVSVPVTGTLVMNEQSTSGDGTTTSSITVNYFHLTVTGTAAAGVSFSEDVILASASSSVTFTPGGGSGAPPASQPPVLNLPGPQTVQAGQTLNFPVLATDPTPGDDLSLTASGIPANAAFTPNPATGNPAMGQFTFTPSQAQAGQTVTVNFTATDSHNLSTSGSVQISVTSPGGSGPGTGPGPGQSQPPVISVPGPRLIGVGQPLSFTVTAANPGGGPVTLSAAALPPNASFSSATGIFAFTPASNQVGQTYDVTFTATNQQGLSSSAPVQITVVASSNPQPGPIISVPLSPITVPAGGSLGFTVAGSSPIADCAVQLQAANLPDNAAFDASTGAFSFTPAQSQQNEVFTVAFTATDCNGHTASAPVTIVALGPMSATGGQVCASVNKIAFGPTPLGGCCGAATMTVANIGSSPLTIKSATFADGSNFKLEGGAGLPAVLQPGGAIPLSISFMPQTAGTKADTLSISTSDPRHPLLTIQLSGKGANQ